MKNLFTLLLLAVSVLTARAIPAFPYPQTITQPDGSSVTIVMHGDENFNYATTIDGYTVTWNQEGCVVYAKIENNEIKPTGIVAHDAGSRTASDKEYLRSVGKTALPATGSIEAAIASRKAPRHKLSTWDISKFHGLVVLVQFKDRPFLYSNTRELFNNMINGDGYTGYYDSIHSKQVDCTGSVHDYFNENSKGNFAPYFDVVGPVVVDYAQTSPQQANYASSIFTAALKQVDSTVDYSKYDTNGDGVVDMVYFIVSGGGSHAGNNSRYLWPHASIFSGLRLDGVSFGRYACSTELYGLESQKQLDGIGTICHEFSHVLGLEDLYDTDYSGSGGESVTQGTWEIMSGGGYNNYARTPAGYSAYDRYSLGFCTPKVVNAPGTYTLPAFNSGNEALILKTPTANEFFIMENRQLEGWDAYCPGHGMLINHVDSTNVSVWTSNQVNCKPEHNYYKFMPAGGASQSSASDPFPGTGAVTMITNATEPNLLSWAQESCPYIITNIAEEDGNITLKIANDAVIGDVEDFEEMAATTATNLADVQGKYATWSFTKCNVTAPGSGKASGEHSVAMKLPSAITSGDTYYDAYQVSFKVFNPLSMTVKYTLSTSTDGGATWTNAASATGETTQAVSGNGTHVLYWVVNTKQDTPTRYRVILSTGSKTSAVYLDDFTLYYRSATGDINGDGVVNVTDVTALINVILGSASYDASLCDINGDGTINVTDVTALLNLILAAE